MSKKYLVTAIVVLLVVCGGSFYGGMIYGKSKNTRPSFAGGNFQGAKNRSGINGSSLTFGDIISKDNNSITLKLSDNAGSKIVFYSDATQISKFDAGTASDLVKDVSVSITGTPNSDGSVTAQSIQIRPANNANPK